MTGQEGRASPGRKPRAHPAGRRPFSVPCAPCLQISGRIPRPGACSPLSGIFGQSWKRSPWPSRKARQKAPCSAGACPVSSRHALTVYVSPCSSTRPCCNAGAPCPAVLSTCLHVYMFTCLHVYKLLPEMAYLSAKTDIQRDKHRQTKTGAIKPRRFHFHLRASPCPCPSISKGTGQASPIGSAPGFPLR